MVSSITAGANTGSSAAEDRPAVPSAWRRSPPLMLAKGPSENPDGSRTEPSGRGYFPGEFNGADVTVKDSKRFADTGSWGFFNFYHHEPKAPMATVKAKEECAFCHIAYAKKDEVWTQFYPLLDKLDSK